MDKKLRSDWVEPLPSRLPADSALAVLASHRQAIDRGDPGYLDPTTGLFVMTAAELASRGYCCENGCRHCPYE